MAAQQSFSTLLSERSQPEILRVWLIDAADPVKATAVGPAEASPASGARVADSGGGSAGGAIPADSARGESSTGTVALGSGLDPSGGGDGSEVMMAGCFLIPSLELGQFESWLTGGRSRHFCFQPKNTTFVKNQVA